MSFDLIGSIKMLFSEEVITKASIYLDESTSAIKKAMDAILPLILTSISDKVQTSNGVNDILLTAQNQYKIGAGGVPEVYFNTDGGGLLNKGAGLLSELFGSRSQGMTTNVSDFAKIKPTSAIALMSMTLPSILQLIGKCIADDKLDARRLRGFFEDQKDRIALTIPPDFKEKGLISNGNDKNNHLSEKADKVLQNRMSANEENGMTSSSSLTWLMALLLLVLGTGAFLYFWKGSKPANDLTASMGDSNHRVVSPVLNSPGSKLSLTGSVDADGNFIYNEGDTVFLNLPDNNGLLKIGRYSTEAKLVAFLQNPMASDDSLNGNWFEFTRVRFKSGSLEIKEISMNQLQNIVAITHAFPSSKFQIGGYNDSNGSSSDIALAKKRAHAIATQLTRLGASTESISGDVGYGAGYPAADNKTKEGQAMNRRVAIHAITQ